MFAGGCTVAADESVCGDGLDVVDGLAALVDANLVRLEGTDEQPRFVMLETIREYTAELLDESDEREEVRRRHTAYFLSVAEEAEPHLRESPGTWLERLELLHNNLRAALDRIDALAEHQSAMRLAGALWRFWYLKGHLTEGRARLEGALANDGRPTPARAKALIGAAVMAVNFGETSATVRRAEEGVAVCLEWGSAYAGFMLGNALTDDDPARSQGLLRDLIDTAVDLCRTAVALSQARKPAVAVRLIASFTELRQDVGARGAWLARMNEDTLAATRAQLDAEAFADAWEQGRQLTSDAALALALAELS